MAAPQTRPGRRLSIVILVLIGGVIALNLPPRAVDPPVGGRHPPGRAGSSYGKPPPGARRPPPPLLPQRPPGTPRPPADFPADPAPLENAYLDRADNAAFALGLAGNAPRPIEFIEGVHGYGESRGLGAIPIQWKISLLVLAAAVVVLAWSRSRRFGPPDRP